MRGADGASKGGGRGPSARLRCIGFSLAELFVLDFDADAE